MISFDNIQEYERLRAKLKALEDDGKWESHEALELDQRLVELERQLPDSYVHPDDEKYERDSQGEGE